MAKLPNRRIPLEELVGTYQVIMGADQGVNVPHQIELVEVSDLTDPSATDPKGVPWRAHVLKDYEVQRAALKAGTLQGGMELLPRYAIEILKDGTEPNYTVTTLIAPSDKHSHGFVAIGMVRPDVVGLSNGENYVKLWYTPLLRSGLKNAFLRTDAPQEYFSLSDFLMIAAYNRAKPVVSSRNFSSLYNGSLLIDDVMVFADDAISTHAELQKWGFKLLINDLGVPDLKAEGDCLDFASARVNVFVKPDINHKLGLPRNLAKEMVVDYLVNGYGVPDEGRLVCDALSRIEKRTNNLILTGTTKAQYFAPPLILI